MERASRFLVDQQCGKKDAELFKSVMVTVSQYIDQTDDLSFLSDRERRYGNMLFSLCSEILRTGKHRRFPKVLPKGVLVCIKNKGDQNHKRGPNRPKYQAALNKHPETKQNLPSSEIHVEAQNGSLRRKNSAFRRKRNTYAKNDEGLQRTIDVHLLIHNFI